MYVCCSPFYPCCPLPCTATSPPRVHAVGYWLATKQQLGSVHVRSECLSLTLQGLTKYNPSPHISNWSVPSTTLSVFCNSGFWGFRHQFLRGSRDLGYLSGAGVRNPGTLLALLEVSLLESLSCSPGQQTAEQSKVTHRCGCAW